MVIFNNSTISLPKLYIKGMSLAFENQDGNGLQLRPILAS